jgi:hypothetical protein
VTDQRPGFRRTNAAEKLLTSLINGLVAVIASLPWLLLQPELLHYQLLLVALFLAENLVAAARGDRRLPGMWLQGTVWQHRYPLRQHLLHALLYSASFATAVFWVWFPGDLLLINLLLLQLPCVRLTGTTLHGWLAGGMVDVKRPPGGRQGHLRR